MGQILLALLIFFLLVAAVMAAVVMAARRRVLEKHRVVSDVASGAPISWLADPRAPARLHRRLARVGSILTSVLAAPTPSSPSGPGSGRGRSRRKENAQAPEGPVHAAARALQAQAVQIDAHLVRLAVLSPAARRPHLATLAAQVAEVEAATNRLFDLQMRFDRPDQLSHHHQDLEAAAHQVDLLTRAHEELLRLDINNGLQPRPGAAAHSDRGDSSLPPPPARPQAAEGQ